MSKHKRLKAAKRKQHNKSAKARNLEWLSYCSMRRQQAEAHRSQREAEALANPSISESPPPADPLDKLLDGFLDGGKLPAGLYHPDGTLDLFNIVKRARQFDSTVFIDTEGTLKYPHVENKDESQLGSDKPSA